MCGIAGIIANNSKEYIQEMVNVIAHRGPDDFGIYSDRNLSLGHRRLSILDLSENAHQPMHSHDKNWTIIFNGEIYNHMEIREGLKNKYVFKSSGDTETLLYAFIEYGVEIFNQLNGIFSFAIYDHKLGDVYIVRDQFGVKPLYYYNLNGIFMFGSEIKSLIQAKGFDASINLESIVNYISLLWSPGEATPFFHVRKLLPGRYIKVNIKNSSEPKVFKYYEIPFKGIYSQFSEKEIVNQLEAHLLRAVERQLLSDVPVGFFLSGGLDSSLIVAIAKKLRPNEKLRCYTIKTLGGDLVDEGFADDLSYARQLAKKLDLDLVEVEVDVNVISEFDKMIYHLDEPQADAAPLNVLRICEQAKKDGFKVLLGGTAGDDIFTGYRRHQAINFEKKIHKIPLVIRKVIKSLASKLPSSGSTFRRIKKVAVNIEKASIDRLYGYFEWLEPKETKKLFSTDNQTQLINYNPGDYFKSILRNIPDEHSPINQYLYWELKSFLVDHNLNYTDKMSMSVGIEVRVPFLDKDLVEFSTTIPPDLKLRGNVVKYILKKVAERYLPESIIYRPKTGFGAPIRQWVINDLSDKINEYLSKDSIEKRGIFDFNAVQKLINDNKSGLIDASYPILALMAIESWFIKFKD